MESIYLDHAAFTPLEAAAVDAMAVAAKTQWGNPSSLHAAGRRARAAIDEARASVGDYLAVDPTEITFWGSAREAFLAALAALAATDSHGSGSLVSTRIEHPSLRGAVEAQRGKWETALLDAPQGDIDLNAAAETLANAKVVALSGCNHELGTAVDITALRALAPSAVWIVDAVQTAPWLEFGPWADDRTLLVVGSSKLGGPPGLSALRAPHALRRALGGIVDGPETPPSWLSVIGFGAALKARSGAGKRAAALGAARAQTSRLLSGLRSLRPDLVRNGGSSWLGPILSVSIPGANAMSLESGLDLVGIAVSRTAACRQGLDTESKVVRAAFPNEPWRARSALRWSVGWHTTDAEISDALARGAAPLVPPSRLESRPSVFPSPVGASPLAAIPSPAAETDLE